MLVVEAMFRSYHSLRNRAFRAANNIPSEGTAVIVQSMCFGSLTTLSSGTGVAYLRSPDTGADVVSGTYVSRAEGAHKVVRGSREMQVDTYTPFHFACTRYTSCDPLTGPTAAAGTAP